MSDVRFAGTKIQPPRVRLGVLARPRIGTALAAALASKPVVLVCAPAGFGKTEALVQAVRTPPDPLPAPAALAWIGADADDDLERFAACLVAALEPFDLPWRVSPDALLAGLGDGPQARGAFAAELLNALAATEVARGLIVVDDVHRLRDEALFAFLALFVERLPPHWGVVLAAREDPPLPLARWRARGELAEWRQDDLRFTPDEVSALVALRAGTGAAAPEPLALHTRTDGWAAGIGLLLGEGERVRSTAAAAARRVADRAMFDYLASEVLDGMAPPLREFLLRCSVLPELSAARCAAVSGDPQAAAWLELIERRGLFVSVLDEREPTLRLHDLFRDFLEERLQREHGDELPSLLQRAAADEPDPLRRIGYRVRAGDWAAAETTLCGIGPGLLADGAVPQVLRLLALLPAERRESSPALLYLRGLCAWAHWDWLEMGHAMARAAAAYLARGDSQQALRAQAALMVQRLVLDELPAQETPPGWVDERLAQAEDDEVRALVWVSAGCWHALGRSALDEVAAPFRRLVELLERGASPMLWFQCQPPTAFLGLPGVRAPLQRYVAGVLRVTDADRPSGLRVLAQALQAGLALFGGEPEAALALLQQADEDSRWLNRPPVQSTYLHTVGAFTHAVLGDRETALAHAQALLDGLHDERSSGRLANWLRHYLYLKLRIAAVLDDAPTQREMAGRLAAADVPPDRYVFQCQRGSLAARLAALDGRWAEAAAGFAQALHDETAVDHYGQAGELRARWAQALLMEGRRDEAAAALGPLFERIARDGEVAPLWLAGRRALGTLAAADWGDRLAPAALQRLRDAAQRVGAAAAPAAAQTLSPARVGGAGLTAREVDVLAAIAAGDSNKLIARALDLSPHTVKRHVANILDKLALSSRGQAAAWYREHA